MVNLSPTCLLQAMTSGISLQEKSEMQNPVDTTIVYLEADTYPSFPGGEKAKEKYIADHIQCEHNNELCYAIVSAVVERD